MIPSGNTFFRFIVASGKLVLRRVTGVGAVAPNKKLQWVNNQTNYVQWHKILFSTDTERLVITFLGTSQKLRIQKHESCPPLLLLSFSPPLQKKKPIKLISKLFHKPSVQRRMSMFLIIAFSGLFYFYSFFQGHCLLCRTDKWLLRLFFEDNLC